MHRVLSVPKFVFASAVRPFSTTAVYCVKPRVAIIPIIIKTTIISIKVNPFALYALCFGLYVLNISSSFFHYYEITSYELRVTSYELHHLPILASASDVGHLKNRQKHRYDHPPDNDTHKYNHQRLKECGQAGNSGIQELGIKVSDLFKHLIQLAYFFANVNHLGNHRRKKAAFLHRYYYGFTFPHIILNLFDDIL